MKKEVKRIAVIGMTENKGGIENIIMNIYRNIDKTQIQFDFLLHHNSKEMAYEETAKKMGGRVFRILYGERESVFKARNSLLTYFKKHPEVVAVHLHINYPYCFPLKIAKKAGIATRIIHSHSSAILFDKKEGIHGMLNTLRNKLVYKQIKKYPNVFFACSDLAARANYQTDRYVWIKNGIDIAKYKYNEQIRMEHRKRHNINEKEVVIGCIGRICENKNSLFVLEIFRQYLGINPNSKLVYIGDGEQRQLLENKINEYNLGGKVEILGMVSDVSKWYQAIDIILLPSKFEGFPVVLVEGQVSGVKCISSDVVTEQAKMTDLVIYKSNNDTATSWALEIDKLVSEEKEREKYSVEMDKLGFGEDSMTNEIMKYYIEAI